VSYSSFSSARELRSLFFHRSAEHFFFSSVIFTDEICLGTDGIINIHKQQQWAEENPHVVIQSSQRQRCVWAGIVGYCFVGLHVLPHWFTGKHYRDFLLHDLPELLEYVPLAVRPRIWYVQDGAPAHLAASREMFSVKPTMTNGQVEEHPLHGLHARQIWILWICTCEETKTSCACSSSWQRKRHITIALWMSLRLSATILDVIFEQILRSMTRVRWNLLEDILSTCYKHTNSAITKKLNVTGHMLIWTFFPWFGMRN
jgi:hypothetical protein